MLAAVLALFFAFDGLALAIAWFPHFMMFLVGTGMMVLAALVLRRLGIALVFFVLCLGAREDAGFHLFAFLSLYLALIIVIVLVFGAVIAIARVPLRQFVRAVREPAVIAFATTSSESALPKAMQAMERFGVPATTRASFAFYNTREEVDALVRGIRRVKEMFA